jgi:transaldolase
MNPLLELTKQGQSIWLDFITRQIMRDGKLQSLIENDGLRGITSNPTIFQKAITGSPDYDKDIEMLLGMDKDAPAIFEELAIQDIQRACDLFLPVYERTKGADGFVSIEVNPHLANDTQKTLEEARRLFKAVNRPNVMIKIPATKEGLPAIEKALGEGLNINITLIFSLDRYQQVMDAWLAGLEHLAKTGKPLSATASVASFFVSRVDTLVDDLLAKRGGPEQLKGRAAIANARLAYEMFEKFVSGERFKALAAKGARVQRPLWASTSAKNPEYRDVIYVEELIGPDTVNTLPPQTIDAFRDHGKAAQTLKKQRVESYETIDRLARAGIDMKQVTWQLEVEGVRLFTDSYDSLIKSIEQKRQALAAR